MRKKYTVEKLLEDALDTSWLDYQMILNAFDGVKASSECEKIWCSVVFLSCLCGSDLCMCIEIS